MSKVTIKDIKEKYIASKETEKKFKWTYYVRRPVSYYLAWPFLKFGISATTVTVLWLLIAAIGCVFIASGDYVNMIIGAALLELAVIFDCVDGHIARFTRPTRTGDILDTWVGEILLVSSIFSIGIGLYNAPDHVVNKLMPFMIDDIWFVYLGFIGSLVALASWTVRLHWRTIALRASINDTEIEMRSSRNSMIIDNMFHYSGALTMLMVVSSIFHILDVMLILVSAVYGTYLIMMMFRIVRKARALDSRGS